MTISSTLKNDRGGSNIASVAWNTELTSTSDTPLEEKGAIRYDNHPILGWRGFKYCRVFQSGGMTANQIASQLANVAITNITSGTTVSILTSSLTADIYVDGILYCTDDAGAAGAAPEGEKGRIVANTTTVVTINSDDAFSVAPAANDDFAIHVPFAVDDSADGDAAWIVQGVVMADQDQYDYGWVQFKGIHTNAAIVAASAALPVNEGVVADAALLADGAGDAVDLRVATVRVGVTADQVLREAVVYMNCGEAFQMGLTTT